MDKKLIVVAVISTAFSLPLLSQTDFGYNLTRHKGNKIVLLGEWRGEDSNKWKEVIDFDGVYEHGFNLLNREKFMEVGGNLMLLVNDRTIDAFERWMRQKYGLSAGARWLALDNENNFISAGVDVPNGKEFDRLLEQKGIKSPLRKVREFLIENPGHLEARADLLRETRRRALHKMPVGTSEDLNTESDLRIWGVLAAETDKVFSGSWQGIDIRFFAPHKDQPEKFSNLMKNVFRKHISKVESAIKSDPANEALWNIWAWMARSSDGYNWNSFINSVEPFKLFTGNTQSPARDVCVWLVDEFRTKKDWGAVIKYAPLARNFSNDFSWNGSIGNTMSGDWAPGGRGIYQAPSPAHIEGYPATSAYAPHLEALLRLGNIEEANNVYDGMIRRIGNNLSGYSGNRDKTDNALVAANVARSVGMEDLAKIWEQGKLISQGPFNSPIIGMSLAWPSPYYYIFAQNGSDFSNKFSALFSQLSPRLMAFTAQWRDDNILGWRIDEGERWGLFSDVGRLLAQGSEIPDKDAMQNILKNNGFISSLDFYRRYIAEFGSTPGIELLLTYEIIDLNRQDQSADQASALSEDSRDEFIWGEASRLLRGTLNSPETLLNFFFADNKAPSAAAQSQLMKSLSKQYLSVIELSLEKKPSSQYLWNLWFFWRSIEGGERPLVHLVELIKHSPLSSIGTLPNKVIEAYYQECRKNGKWPIVIGLLETVWNRDFSRNNEIQDEPKTQLDRIIQNQAKQAAASLGDRVAIPLIEAYLNDNRPREASDIFNAWLDSGGSFTDISKIVELAKSKGQERLAREWEERMKK